MALGLNIVVGFAGLLDLGYVAFFAIGAYTVGWFGSGFFSNVNDQKGIHVLVGGLADKLPGIHFNFLLILVSAVIAAAVAGVLIGLPTLRLRGDYIAIVTLAFGEIIGRIAINGDGIVIRGQPLTAGRQGITPVDQIDLPFLQPFGLLELRPWYWFALVLVAISLFVNFRLRDSRLGRAWIALREDEIAAVAMGVPSVKTKLLAYATGAAFGGIAGAFLGSFLNTVNADQFQFYVSILVLGMIILGGLGSIWGVVLGAVVLSFINNWFIPDVLNDRPGQAGPVNFDATQITFGIYGFLLVMMMILRPQGLLPERRRKMELADEVETNDEEPLHGTRMSATQTPTPPPSLANPAILDAVDITKQFGGLTAVSDVSFSLPERSIVSIIGPNGAGKTTFFNMLTGFYRPTIGTIAFAGSNITGARPDQVMKAGMARTFQNIRLFSTMTAMENVMIGEHSRMHAGLFGSIVRTPRIAARGEGRAREGARRARVRRHRERAGTTSSRSTCPTATSGGSRSPARWPRTRRSCCWTSRPRA